MAKLDKNRYPWPWRDRMEVRFEDMKTGKSPAKVDYAKEMKEEHAALIKLMDVSNNLPEGQVVGAVLSWPRGDGAAYYIVTKEKPLTLQWIPYSDAWQVEYALIKGLDKADILDTLRREKEFSALFSGKKKRGKVAS